MKQIKSILILSLIIFSTWACTSEKEPLPDTTDCTNVLTIEATSEVASNCGQSDGGFTVAATGGSGNYTYQIASAGSQTSPVFENLAAGVYTVVATDSDLGCTAEIQLQVRNQDGVNATVATTESDCNVPGGTIQLTATDGVQPYEYKLDDGTFQASDNFTGIAPGSYMVTVRDANGCEVELQAQVGSTVVFASIRSLVQTNCAVSGCHNGSISPDFRNDATIIGRASRIQSRTSSRTMPPSSSGRSLSNEEIANIVCWVNDGAPGN
ncbi:hypothetical protein [Roseivirga sp. E12]|uniref:hypothetical protein n=1 Tax=Roseivirga sp. E12 TaxID=2819237 RepID=UPI001ABC5BC1|nr:hypothetical protein [Roseivirga sp. E12]MBO3697130.1 hypothetical protein [Roseivirga sp. E12]